VFYPNRRIKFIGIEVQATNFACNFPKMKEDMRELIRLEQAGEPFFYGVGPIGCNL